MPLSPEGRTLRARAAALTRAATENPKDMTRAAREAFARSFIDRAWDEIGPFRDALIAEHPELPESALFPQIESEVLRRADVLRTLQMTRVSFAAAKARDKKKGRAATVRSPAPAPGDRSEVESTARAEEDR